jgi:hypothetical protein
MDNKRTLFDFNDRLIAGTPSIRVPKKMVFITKEGKFKEVDTLTKSGIVSMRNKKRLIKFETGEKNEIDIIDDGYSRKSRANNYITDIRKNKIKNLETLSDLRRASPFEMQMEIRKLKSYKKPNESNKKRLEYLEGLLDRHEKKIKLYDAKSSLYSRALKNNNLN